MLGCGGKEARTVGATYFAANLASLRERLQFSTLRRAANLASEPARC